MESVDPGPHTDTLIVFPFLWFNSNAFLWYFKLSRLNVSYTSQFITNEGFFCFVFFLISVSPSSSWWCVSTMLTLKKQMCGNLLIECFLFVRREYSWSCSELWTLLVGSKVKCCDTTMVCYHGSVTITNEACVVQLLREPLSNMCTNLIFTCMIDRSEGDSDNGEINLPLIDIWQKEKNNKATVIHSSAHLSRTMDAKCV